MSIDIIFDLETFPSVFTAAFEMADSEIKFIFEISEFNDQSLHLYEFLMFCQFNNYRMVGYNSLGFDYPVIHMFMQMGGKTTAHQLYEKAMAIINSQDNDRFAHTVYPKDRKIQQIDLFKIHHFDNKAKATSLKMLEFNMRSNTIEDLPFPVGSILNPEQIKVLKHYNQHDVSETKKFYHESSDMIRFREELSHKYNRDFMNHNDTKIGKDYFQMKLEEHGVSCYEYGSHGRSPKQTKRPQIHLDQAIFSWIQFEQPELQKMVNWLRQQVITETKGVFKDLVARVNGFEFVFGLGGIHGSIESEVVESDEQNIIIDLDVTSYYPSLAIVNGFYPEHLGSTFCDIYRHLKEQRVNYKKGTAENAMLKLALNGVYGDSNNKFSVFYDPLFTMSITLNGQLLLCVLAEQLMKIHGLRLIQVNTDGLTVRVPRDQVQWVDTIRKWWEQMTRLELEEARYSRMFIRDVNNYIAEYEDGKLKRKGAYEYVLGWHQNHSALVIPMVAEKVLVEGIGIREAVMNHSDIMDFMLRTKVPRSSKLVIQDEYGVDHQLQNITRYLVTKDGGKLFKLMPPTPKMLSEGKMEWRRIGVESGWNVTECNVLKDSYPEIDFEYYVKGVEKLVLGLS